MRITQKKQFSIDFLQSLNGKKRKVPEWILGVEYILTKRPEILELIQSDLNRGHKNKAGRTGMTARALLVAMIVQKNMNCSYRKLESEMLSNLNYMRLAEINPGDNHLFSKSSLQANLVTIQPETWTKISDATIKFGIDEDATSCAEVRMDSTTVAVNSSYPNDTKLLYQGIERLQNRAKRLASLWNGKKQIKDNKRKAKEAYLKVSFKQTKEINKTLKKLIKLAHNTIQMAEDVVAKYKKMKFKERKFVRTFNELQSLIVQVKTVILQTETQMDGAKRIDAEARIHSYSEPHARFIVKGGRNPVLGRKLFLITNREGLVTTAKLTEKNNNDSAMLKQLVDAHVEQYGVPYRIAGDRGFISVQNIQYLKDLNVKTIGLAIKGTFTKEHLDITNNNYRYMQRFRAGVEGNISHLKRSFGLRKCNWKGERNFEAGVLSSIAVYNIIKLSKLLI